MAHNNFRLRIRQHCPGYCNCPNCRLRIALYTKFIIICHFSSWIKRSTSFQLNRRYRNFKDISGTSYLDQELSAHVEERDCNVTSYCRLLSYVAVSSSQLTYQPIECVFIPSNQRVRSFRMIRIRSSDPRSLRSWWIK